MSFIIISNIISWTSNTCVDAMFVAIDETEEHIICIQNDVCVCVSTVEWWARVKITDTGLRTYEKKDHLHLFRSPIHGPAGVFTVHCVNTLHFSLFITVSVVQCLLAQHTYWRPRQSRERNNKKNNKNVIRKCVRARAQKKSVRDNMKKKKHKSTLPGKWQKIHDSQQ